MKIFRFPQILWLLAFGLVLIFASCKEKNIEYPPPNWSEYSYLGPGISLRDISTVYYENDHSVWLGAKNKEGLLHQDGYKWNVYDKVNTGIDFDSVTSIVRDGNGKLWIGWKKGLASFDGTSWQKINEFDNRRVTAVIVEGIGNIIVGMKGESGGTAVFQNSKWFFYSLSNSGIPSENINSLTSDHEQTLWIATADKGIILFKNSTWENMSSEIPLLSQEFTCVTTASDGSIWAGSAAAQLIHFYNNTYTVYNTGTSKPITSIVIADNKTVWCSTFGAGLVNFDGTNWNSFTTDNAALPSNDILCLSKGFPGNLFFSIPGGELLLINQ